jgi:hypothetical protein
MKHRTVLAASLAGRALWVMTLALACGCASAPANRGGAEPATAEVGVRLAQEMAADASRLDVVALSKLIPQTDRIVYVSDGHPVRGNEYLKVMGDFYGTLRQLDFKWEKLDGFRIGDNEVGVIGWANAHMVTKTGETEVQRAIFTMVFARDAEGWKRVIAHKTVLKE